MRIPLSLISVNEGGPLLWGLGVCGLDVTVGFLRILDYEGFEYEVLSFVSFVFEGFGFFYP